MSGSAAARTLPPCPHCGQEHQDTALKCPDTDLVLPLRGRLLDGKFRLVRPLGTGGMASVWLALNVHVDKQVAIKIIRPEVARSETMVARFRSEARAAGRIGHPNICDIHDFGVGPVGPYIVMEYLQGRSLAELLNRKRRLDGPTAVAVVRAALAGLAAAHEQGIVHRDLKPENVFLHRPTVGDPVVKLMDFGVAKFTDGSGEAQTEHGALLGTPEYMAPEQFKGAAHADHRSDIWAVGAILYRALTGKNPFSGPTVAATLLAVTHDPPEPIEKLSPEVPRGLIDVVMRCLAKNPADRFASVEALDEALRPFDTEPIDPELFAEPSEDDTDAEAAGPTVAAPEAPSPAMLHTTRPAPGGAERSPRRTRGWIVAALVVAVGSAGAYGWLSSDTPGDPGLADDALASGVATSNDGGSDAAISPAQALARTEDAVDDDRTAGATPPDLGARAAPEDVPPEAGDGAQDDPGEPDPSSEAPPHPDDPDPGAGTTPPRGDPPPDPPGVIRSGPWVTLAELPPRTNHGDARRYCEKLGEEKHAGIARWHLANPSTLAKFQGVRGVRKAEYWTSARWRGRVIVIGLPSGKKSSVKAERRSPRPFCVAKWP